MSKEKPPVSSIAELASWMTGFSLFTFVLPGILLFFLPPDLRAAGVATYAGTPLIEFLSIGVGIGLGIDPVISFFLTVLPCTGICMLMVGLLGFLGESSARAKKMLDKVQKKLEKYPRLRKYGAASNFLFVLLLGIYIVPGISVILGWPKGRSVIFMFGGISFITGLIGLGTLGIIDLFFV